MYYRIIIWQCKNQCILSLHTILKKTYKHLLFYLIFFLLNTTCFSQKLFNDNIKDTLSIDEFGKKVELENDLKESERLNDLLIDEVVKRKKIKNVPKKIRLYYENAYLVSLISKAYFDGRRGDYKKEIAVYFKILKNRNADRLIRIFI